MVILLIQEQMVLIQFFQQLHQQVVVELVQEVLPIQLEMVDQEDQAEVLVTELQVILAQQDQVIPLL